MTMWVDLSLLRVVNSATTVGGPLLQIEIYSVAI